jgi:hypothetical protein
MRETRLVGASGRFSGIVPSHPTSANCKEIGRRVSDMHFSWFWLSLLSRPVLGRAGVGPAERFATVVVVGIGSWAVKIRRQVRFEVLNCSSRFLLVVVFLVDI